ncbi:MAG: MATE family efflux transporter [Oscillospiraceae bacterium]|nr:MATE family efflux transporter [Oscillospiraceae bacterium]
MANIKQDLTQGRVPQQLVRYSAPLVLSSLLQAMYSIADMAVAGHFITGVAHDNAMSALNTVGIIMNMITQIAIGLTIGGNVLISQYFSKQEDEKRRHASGTLFSLCMIIGLVLAVVFLLCGRPFLILLRSPALEDSVAYFSICAIGIFFIFAYNALSAVLRGVGNSDIPLFCIIFSVALNIVLDLYFVAGLGWGVRGAAVATLLSQILAFGIALFFCLRHGADLGIHRRYIIPERSMVKATLRIGLPTALQYTIASLSWLTMAGLINGHGTAVSAGNGVSNRIRDICQIFITSMTGAAGTMCAQCIGAKLFDRAEQVMKTCFKITIFMSVIIIVVVEIFAPTFCRMFNPSEEALKWAVLNLRIEIVGQVFYAGMFSYNTVATGSGHTIFVMLNSFLNCIVVRLILAIILNHFLGPVGIYIACGVAVASSVPVSIWFYRSNRWRTSVGLS